MPTANQDLHVEELLGAKRFGLELLAGAEGLTRSITGLDVQKPGLALAGHLESLHSDRVQVLGFSEISYLRTLDEAVARERVRGLGLRQPPCVVVTRGLEVPAFLVEICRELGLPLLRTPQGSAIFLGGLRGFLAARLSSCATMHGVLCDVFGVGVLLLGKSGIGKSEVALELVLRGHRLVADDIVEIRATGGDVLIGSGPDLIKHHIEIRGLGILNIKDLFGIAAVRDAKRVDLVVELVEWSELEEYDRLGVDEQTRQILGLEVPLIRLPVRPGRNMSSIIEVAARNQLLKVRGHYSAREFQDRLVRAIADSGAPGRGGEVE